MDKNLFTSTSGTDLMAYQDQMSSQPHGPMACYTDTRCYGGTCSLPLIMHQRNMTWTFDGGYTRTGKIGEKTSLTVITRGRGYVGDGQMAVKVAMKKIQTKTSKNALTEQSTTEQNVQPVIFS